MTPAEVQKNLKIGEKALANLASQDYSKEKLEDFLKKLITDQKIGTGDLLWPLRVALTGKQGSPNPFEVAWVLGKKEVLARIKTAIAKLQD